MKSIVVAATKRIEVALIKSLDAYKWYTATKTLPLERRGKEVNLKAGEIVGLRPSSNGKMYRLITKSLGESIVFSIDPADYAFLMKRLTPTKASGVKKVLDREDKEATRQKNAEQEAEALAIANMKKWAQVQKLLKVAPPEGLDVGAQEWASYVADGVNKLSRKLKVDEFDPTDSENPTLVTKMLDALLDLLETRPKSVAARGGKDAKAIRIANLIVKDSVRRLWTEGTNNLSSGNLDMGSLYLSDAADHLNAAILIAQYDGSVKSARAIEQATRLDTSSREEFHEKAWDWIQEYAR